MQWEGMLNVAPCHSNGHGQPKMRSIINITVDVIIFIIIIISIVVIDHDQHHYHLQLRQKCEDVHCSDRFAKWGSNLEPGCNFPIRCDFETEKVNAAAEIKSNWFKNTFAWLSGFHWGKLDINYLSMKIRKQPSQSGVWTTRKVEKSLPQATKIGFNLWNYSKFWQITRWCNLH